MVFRQFHLQKRVSAKRLEVAWVRLGLPLEELDAILTSGRFKRESVNIFKFTTLGSGYLAEGDIKQGMRIFCEIVTDDVDGGASRIPYDIFSKGISIWRKFTMRLLKSKQFWDLSSVKLISTTDSLRLDTFFIKTALPWLPLNDNIRTRGQRGFFNFLQALQSSPQSPFKRLSFQVLMQF